MPTIASWQAAFLAVAVLAGLPAGALAEVTGLRATDVTTRSLAAVWAYDAIVRDASLRVFSDEAGTVEITESLDQTLVSEDFPPALELGIVKVEVTGLPSGDCVYIQAETHSAASAAFEPPGPPFLEVCLAQEVRIEGDEGFAISNDLIRHALRTPDESTTATGGLLVVGAPDVAAYPLSAFVQQGFAAVNLHNLFDPATGQSAEIPEGTTLELLEYRGRRCSEITEQDLRRLRKLPADPLLPAVSEPRDPEPCYFADTDCNEEVEEADAQRIFDILDARFGECRFNRDLDLVSEGISREIIDILDAQRCLNQLGEPVP